MIKIGDLVEVKGTLDIGRVRQINETGSVTIDIIGEDAAIVRGAEEVVVYESYGGGWYPSYGRREIVFAHFEPLKK